ncbi:hypothetical protein Q763_12105 [Flavobacterium beibuense F44-8]|uniref:Cytochrome c domain-containing protein n=1 Tax=Flavobacterium beibuense F44-8 TaxID=1406840 RepID=A0A0A2LUV3_9FLAO|nr:hypothetical protein [Flavobacterium beibuense]KGO79940.1 hypothetical protein Q763_12105 [Flavobacterium beibuense F44-8]
MKKAILYTGLLALFFVSCDSNTYEDISEEQNIVGTVTYTANVKTIIDNNCLSCHAPGGVASFRPLLTYAQVKDAVENHNLLGRIQLQNGQQQLMPQTGRMPQANINLILQWNTDGLLEN